MSFAWSRRLSIAAALALIPIALVPAAPAHATGGCAHVASDFNGDGYGDLATSAFTRTVGGVPGAGSVQIDYGSAAGINRSKAQYLTQDSAGMPGAPVEQANFGTALSSGYFNGDCYADLAISGGDLDSGSNGWVIVLYGSASGLTTNGAVMFDGRSAVSQFGIALASGDFNHDGYDDLAAGAPHAYDGTVREAGEVGIMYGGPAGLAAPSAWFNQSSAGVPGSSEKYDQFGLSLAAGDFTGNGFDDLAIGTPDESDGSMIAAGAIRFLDGSSAGLHADDPVTITQATTGVPGVNETGDHFGASLAAGDVNGDGRDDLIAGDPDEGIGTVRDAGDIAYLPGGKHGVTGAGTMRFSEATSGVPGSANRGDEAGFSVAVGDFDGNGFADIALGVPGETVGNLGTVAGAVIALPGSGSGPRTGGAVEISQATSGVPGDPTETFGWTIHAAHLRGATRTDLTVGAWVSPSGRVSQAGLAYDLPGVHGGGLTGSGSSVITQAGPGPGFDASFGWALG